jgi:hypothetical protein
MNNEHKLIKHGTAQKVEWGKESEEYEKLVSLCCIYFPFSRAGNIILVIMLYKVPGSNS